MRSGFFSKMRWCDILLCYSHFFYTCVLVVYGGNVFGVVQWCVAYVKYVISQGLLFSTFYQITIFVLKINQDFKVIHNFTNFPSTIYARNISDINTHHISLYRPYIRFIFTVQSNFFFNFILDIFAKNIHTIVLICLTQFAGYQIVVRFDVRQR